MKKLSIEERKKIALDILKYITDLCEKMELKYSLAWGTLLGAVRHKGFIPWDDDVDIVMPRRDYTILMRYLQSSENKLYELYSIYNHKNYYYSIARVIDRRTVLVGERKTTKKQCDCGVFIDIYPIDNSGDSLKKAYKFYYRQNRLEYLKYLALEEKFTPSQKGIINTIIKLMLYLPCKIIGYRFFENVAESNSNKNATKKTNYVCSWCCNGGMQADKLTFKALYFEETCFMEFESYQFKVSYYYHEILSQVYGDYMLLPPVEKRIGNHAYQAYWR